MVTSNKIPLILATLIVAASLAGCAGNSNNGAPNFTPTATGAIQQAGSSTVFPIAEAWAEELAKVGIDVSVQGGGSGAGASKLCAKEIDIGDMSRTMKSSEIATCNANGVDPVAWKVAYDGITIVVSRDNTFAQDMTVDELNAIWKQGSTVQKWSDVRADWPAEAIRLYGPDSDSGTYEYFNEEILGKNCGADGKTQCGPRSDYTPSSDDNVLVVGVEASRYAMGYFGFSYYQENTGKLRAVSIKGHGSDTAIEPTFDTIADGSYAPLSRPIFMVTNGVPPKDTVVGEYLRYAMSVGQSLIEEVGYVPLDANTLSQQRAKL